MLLGDCVFQESKEVCCVALCMYLGVPVMSLSNFGVEFCVFGSR